jgi:hypothetical protein
MKKVAALEAEIERLKFLNQEERQTIDALSKLCTRAAEALEFWMKDLASTEQQYVDAAMRDERLLAELRKGGLSERDPG